MSLTDHKDSLISRLKHEEKKAEKHQQCKVVITLQLGLFLRLND
ncbi:hypothetical protein MIZ03_2287 [Rhodoferax lithotrophicus]|uniref:Uncharacterized protein n=1 Tax=Rhodoferax lithotrophicus TaxID=2798804 RepID=A0ABM7MMB7_9BURK|nr:hypothetical protein MIZ03_2287 [Rhodoferax sp. MIZ03]